MLLAEAAKGARFNPKLLPVGGGNEAPNPPMLLLLLVLVLAVLVPAAKPP